MAKRKDPVADALARLGELKAIDDTAALAKGIAPLLAAKEGYVVARAADLVADRRARDALPAVIGALSRFLSDPKVNDPGCGASLALVRTLVALEAGYEAEDVAMRATRHVRFESVWGGSADAAVSVRGHAVILLAAMGSTQALTFATELLAEADQSPPRERASAPARSDAARAMTMIGSDGAAAVLRFKLLVGDPEPNVLSDCLGGLLAIQRQDALPLAERMLTADTTTSAEAAMLALGGWRDRRAFELLHEHEQRFLTSASQALFLASVAMTRDPKAIDYLIDMVATTHGALKTAASAAIEPLRVLPGVNERLEIALRP